MSVVKRLGRSVSFVFSRGELDSPLSLVLPSGETRTSIDAEDGCLVMTPRNELVGFQMVAAVPFMCLCLAAIVATLGINTDSLFVIVPMLALTFIYIGMGVMAFTARTPRRLTGRCIEMHTRAYRNRRDRFKALFAEFDDGTCVLLCVSRHAKFIDRAARRMSELSGVPGGVDLVPRQDLWPKKLRYLWF